MSQRASCARTNDPGRTAKARGPGLPTLRPSLLYDLQAMGARKPGSQGERAISVKTIAQGMPDDPADPVVTAASFSICWRAMGEAFTRHSLRPHRSFEGGPPQDSGTSVPRERGAVAPVLALPILRDAAPRRGSLRMRSVCAARS